jgi:hypothetical protein
MTDLGAVPSIFDDKSTRRWRLSDPMKWMLKGAGIAIGAVLLLALCLGGWIVYIRAMHGQIAYEYIQQVIAQQQQAPSPVRGGTPAPSPPAK